MRRIWRHIVARAKKIRKPVTKQPATARTPGQELLELDAISRAVRTHLLHQVPYVPGLDEVCNRLGKEQKFYPESHTVVVTGDLRTDAKITEKILQMGNLIDKINVHRREAGRLMQRNQKKKADAELAESSALDDEVNDHKDWILKELQRHITGKK